MQATVPIQTEQQHSDGPDRRRRRIALIVDDSRLQRHILCKTVRGWGFDVVEAASGDAALEICRDVTPDLVLSDWMMPGMNGLEFCDAFRKLEGDEYGYFILLTSKSEKEEVARGLEAGADDFVSKPVDLNELRARITAGDRILQMQRELTGKNQLISQTLRELQRLYDSIDKDLLEAKKLQQSLVRERAVAFEQGHVSLLLRPSGHVGGDLVGFFRSGDNHLGLYAIDVSGHGISSALMTARLAGYLSSTAPDQNVALTANSDGIYRIRPPLEVMRAINNLVLNEMDTEHYFTMLLADVDLNTGNVTLAQAGHPHPLVQRSDGRIEQVGPGGFPVGLVHDAEFSQFDLQLRSGDRLLLCSDGVTECPNDAGDLLDEDGLGHIMHSLHGVTGPTFFEALIWKLSEFAGNQDFPDDVSGVLFEYQASPAT
ncbi:fused response regulator/phosphatase [Pseudosulfitobacter sp. DSM 107133]|jgi:sigma-B regulation protein RsbU (phosphoserine phosphatase)|uniref:PP2C family protein-serine/threonine phosphatase n=1 Tax=Pseudosulfitobacter sp. DSM 107133 TaxID=2883100 RepID=UPI000DF3E722|nr:fused response regulator/phosphatase [Pseudosulfitobacter sp. DSM 107133]UOA25397.1 Phosphate regulon transcriptional regulatory protein PhoB [Pseudosulfitobacter sp. DSM 107133]